MNRRLVLRTFVSSIVLLFPAAGAEAQIQYYVLDGFGGVHAGNGAATVSPATPYFGFDIAADIAYVPGPTGDGVLVLDGFGGVHVGGALVGTLTPDTPYFGFRVAQAIAYRNIPPRLATSQTLTPTPINIGSQSYFALASTTVQAPDDGFLVVMCTATILYRLGTGTAQARFAIGVDALDATVGLTWLTAQLASGEQETVTWQQTAVILQPGLHTAHCLGRSTGSTGTLAYLNPSQTAIFIDANSSGGSAPR